MSAPRSESPLSSTPSFGDHAASSECVAREPLIVELLRGSGRCVDIYDDAWPAILPVVDSRPPENKRA